MMPNEVDKFFNDRLSHAIFLGVVATAGISGNQIKVIQPAQTGADNTFYAAASGLAAVVVAGDTVLCIRAGASWVVVCKVVF